MLDASGKKPRGPRQKPSLKECKKVAIPVVPAPAITFNRHEEEVFDGDAGDCVVVVDGTGAHPSTLPKRHINFDNIGKYATMRPSASVDSKNRGLRVGPHRQSFPSSTISIPSELEHVNMDVGGSHLRRIKPQPPERRSNLSATNDGSSFPSTNAPHNYHSSPASTLTTTTTATYFHHCQQAPLTALPYQVPVLVALHSAQSRPEEFCAASPFDQQSPPSLPQRAHSAVERGNYVATFATSAFTAPSKAPLPVPSCHSAKVRSEKEEGVDSSRQGKEEETAAGGGSRPSPTLFSLSSSHPIYHCSTSVYPPSTYFTTAIQQQQSIGDIATDSKDTMSKSVHLPTAMPTPNNQTNAANANRNSTGSTSSSQTSSGYESVKTGSIPSPSAQTVLANSNSSSSCTSSPSNVVINQRGSVTILPRNRNEKGATTSSVAYSSSSRASICSSSTISESCPSTSKHDHSAESSYGSVTSSREGMTRSGRRRSRVDVASMLKKGISESEIQAEWLQRLGLSQYLPLFISQGYDLTSISKCTPEDLNALGISAPEDRRRLIQDIQSWDIASFERWPSHADPGEKIRKFLPFSEWLTEMGLIQYLELFEEQGYLTMGEMKTLTWEDLEDIGVKKLGHMKRICLALRKLKLLNRSPKTLQGVGKIGQESSGTLRPNLIRQMLAPFPTTSLGASAISYPHTPTLDYSITPHEEIILPDGLMNRRHSQPPAVKGRPQVSSPLAGYPEKPINPVAPHIQSTSTGMYSHASRLQPCFGGGVEEYDGMKAASLARGSPQQCRRVDAIERVGAPPLLNLYRTSQILSEFSRFPTSMSGEELRLIGNNTGYDGGAVFKKRPPREHTPPPPAPVPTVQHPLQEQKTSRLNSGSGVEKTGSKSESNIARIDHMLKDIAQELDSMWVPARTECTVEASALQVDTKSD